jgi:outer membrane protein TolC
VADLVLRVQETYFQYLAARSLQDAEESSVKQAEASLAAAEGRRRAGLATVADVLQARTARSQVRLALQQVEGQALALRGALATLAGLPPTAELDVGTLPARVDAAGAEPRIEAILAEAEARNPELARSRALAEAADARARAASAARRPALSAEASAARTWPLPSDRSTESTLWSFGLVLRVPLFEGLGPTYDALAARAGAEASRARAEATAQRVALDVWTSFQALRTAGRRLESARDLLESARASADVAAGRYREGVGSILDLLNAQASLELARAEDVRARSDWFVSVARLARASGRIDLSTPRPRPAAEGTAP